MPFVAPNSLSAFSHWPLALDLSVSLLWVPFNIIMGTFQLFPAKRANTANR
jgi:hypothetical protein